MAHAPDLTYGSAIPVADASSEARTEFIRKTYAHLLGAVGVFAFLEALLFATPASERLAQSMLGARYGWLIVLGVYMLVSYIAERWARTAVSPAMQYLGLGVYVVAETAIFFPLLWIASRYGGPTVIPAAALITGIIFLGLTGIVFFTARDFSFLGSILPFLGLAALGYIICGIVFGFTLGTGFTVAMIALAGGYILYHTSNVLHHYRVGQHIAASLSLFAAVALLFWYVLQFVMRSRD